MPDRNKGLPSQVPMGLNEESGHLSPLASNSNKINRGTSNLFPLRVGRCQVCLLSPVLLNLVLWTLENAMSHGMKIKGT